MTQSSRQTTAFYVLFGLTALMALVFLWSYLPAVVLACLLALLFHPMYRRLMDVCKGRDWLAMPLTFLGIFLSFILPFVIAGSLAVRVVMDFSRRSEGTTLADGLSLNWLVERANLVLAQIPGLDYQVTPEMVTGQLQAAAHALSSHALDTVRGVGAAVFGVIPVIFICIYFIAALLSNYGTIVTFLHRLSPLDNEIDRLYFRRVRAMALSMVRGTFIVALIQGTLTGLLLAVAGVKYSAFLGLLATIASIIPLGAGIISIPIGLLLIASGNIWQGVLQIAGNLIVVSNVDNVLRPRLVSKEASLHPALTILGLFAGLASFGFLGVIYGPVLMIFFATTIEVYMTRFRPKTE